MTNNTSKITVLSNGNVGIGTTNLNTPFHIVDPSDGTTIAKFSRVGGSSFLASDIGFQKIPAGHFTASAPSFAMVKAISQL